MEKKREPEKIGIRIRYRGANLLLSIHDETFFTLKEKWGKDNFGWIHFKVKRVQTDQHNGFKYKVIPDKPENK